MTSVCFDALPDHSRQCEYAFAQTVRANNSRQCETALTGQFTDKPTRGQSYHRLVNSRTSQLAEMFDLKLEYGIHTEWG